MSLELIIGPMFAGKTSIIMSRVRRFQSIEWPYFIITHSSDTRYAEQSGHEQMTSRQVKGSIVNHNKDTLSAYPTTSLMPIITNEQYIKSKIIIIEEAHFFEDLIEFVKHSIEVDKKQLICVGLNGCAERKPIGHINQLIPFCDNITMLTSLCVDCKEPTSAPFTKRHTDIKNSSQILVGGADKYKAVCRTHFLSL